MHSRTCYICKAFPQNVFSHALSDYLHNEIHIHIGYIWKVFLQSEFSNVSSIQIHQQIRSRIVCIYVTFLLHEFLNVPSNSVPEQMHIHRGCIYKTYFPCDFSNVPSNSLHVLMHSRIGSIYVTFLHILCIFTLVAFEGFFSRVSFPMSPQTRCINRCVVALVAFVLGACLFPGTMINESFRRRCDQSGVKLLDYLYYRISDSWSGVCT